MIAAAPPGPRGRRQRTTATVQALEGVYPAVCALVHRNPLELLVATILSAQTTDLRVNLVTPALFARMSSAADYANADPGELEELIHATGFFRAKSKSLIGMGRALCQNFGGEVPDTMEELVQLPGVGRKTANVILGVAFGKPGFAVDTHVTRLTNRLGLVRSSDPVRIEAEICRLVDPPQWAGFSLRLIQHGREICAARSPKCQLCILEAWCPSSTLKQPRRGSAVGRTGPAAARERRPSPPGR